MKRVDIVETSLMFKYPLDTRQATRFFVVHHIGHIPAGLPLEKIDADRVNDWHREQGWAGIGYHYLICADGHIERGRPRWAIGSHCKGHNFESLGICVVGDFSAPGASPAPAQLDNLVNLLAELCEIYGLLPGDPATIRGHRELTDTTCPGEGLFALLPEIRARVQETLGY